MQRDARPVRWISCALALACAAAGPLAAESAQAAQGRGTTTLSAAAPTAPSAATRTELAGLQRRLLAGPEDAASYVRLAQLQRQGRHEVEAVFSALRAFTLDTSSREAAREAEAAF